MVKQIPLFVTNDSSHIHLAKNCIIRMYRYNREEKGTELNYYMSDHEGISRGTMILRMSDGRQIEPTAEDLKLFLNCPYPPRMKEIMQRVFLKNFNIDHLGNKIVVTPGHLFYKLFRKTLWVELQKWHRREIDIATLKNKTKTIQKSIEDGDFLHVLSKKTLFFKEYQAKFKMTNSKREMNREVGGNNQVFTEKKTTCYREVNFQCYQLIPYMSQMVNIQISQKVKTYNVLSFKASYIGFFCLFGTVESKNIGRQMMLARDVYISTEDNVEDLYTALDLRYNENSNNYVVVNGACIPVSQDIDLFLLKDRFRWIEAYKTQNFTFINFKSGIPYKRLRGDLWVTPTDIDYYSKIVGEWEGFAFITSRYIDLIPYFNHNAFPKNTLSLNALKNSIISLTPDYGLYFRETASAFTPRTPHHRVLLVPVDDFSMHWKIELPKLNVMFTSFRGMTQEDCIVCNANVHPFDCHKFYVLKFKLSKKGRKYFHPVENSGELLGELICSNAKLNVISQTMHAICEEIKPSVYILKTTKKDYTFNSYDLSAEYLFITIEKFHKCGNGDKLCSLHGQKGVIYLSEEMPSVADRLVPDLLVNPLSIIGRQTMGQIFEMMDEGRDYDEIYNPQGKRLPGKALVGPAFYFLINYLSDEHLYVAIDCNKDIITGQPVKGRSRQGGMRAGNMEIFNGFRGNGLAGCYEEKLQDDLIVTKDGLTIPKSVSICEEDAKFFKCKFDVCSEPLIS